MFCHTQKTYSCWNQVAKINCKTALNLTREYYGDKKLKRKNVGSTRLVDFEGIEGRMQDVYGG